MRNDDAVLRSYVMHARLASTTAAPKAPLRRPWRPLQMLPQAAAHGGAVSQSKSSAARAGCAYFVRGVLFVLVQYNTDRWNSVWGRVWGCPAGRK